MQFLKDYEKEFMFSEITEKKDDGEPMDTNWTSQVWERCRTPNNLERKDKKVNDGWPEDCWVESVCLKRDKCGQKKAVLVKEVFNAKKC